MYIIRNFSSEGLSSYECFLVILTKLDQIYFDKVMNTNSIYVIYLSIEMMKWKIDITQH